MTFVNNNLLEISLLILMACISSFNFTLIVLIANSLKVVMKFCFNIILGFTFFNKILKHFLKLQ